MLIGRVIIVGFGLMGGSLARALRPEIDTIIAVDQNAQSCELAITEGVADCTVRELSELTLTMDDLVILATPVRTIVEIIGRLPTLAPEGCMVLDLGSTKQSICRAMSELPGWFQALGGHPMCGREVSGFEHSSAELYHNQTFLLTPTVRTTPHLREIALEIVQIIGANPIVLPPEQHDHAVAIVSHLPYLLSALLVDYARLSQFRVDPLWQISASGFRDMARLAGSNPPMMRDILYTNREAVLAALGEFWRRSQQLEAWLESADYDALLDWLTKRQGDYHEYRQEKFGDRY